jgi:hypothetical protein
MDRQWDILDLTPTDGLTALEHYFLDYLTVAHGPRTVQFAWLHALSDSLSVEFWRQFAAVSAELAGRVAAFHHLKEHHPEADCPLRIYRNLITLSAADTHLVGATPCRQAWGGIPGLGLAFARPPRWEHADEDGK